MFKTRVTIYILVTLVLITVGYLGSVNFSQKIQANHTSGIAGSHIWGSPSVTRRAPYTCNANDTCQAHTSTFTCGSGQIAVCYETSSTTCSTETRPFWECGPSFNNCSCVDSPSVCGNGEVEAGEQCDSGAQNGACPLTCSNSCTVNACSPLSPTGTIDANPTVVAYGTPSNITWSSNNAQNCEISAIGGVGTPIGNIWEGLSGSEVTNPLTSTTAYNLYCDDQLMDTATVTVVTALIEVSTDNNTYSHSLSVDSGSLVYIRWSSTGATTCNVTPGNWSGTSGLQTRIITSYKTYILSCSKNGINVTDQATVQLNTPDFSFVCNSLSKTIPAGQSTFFDTTATALNGFNSQVTVSLNTPLPAGVTSNPVTITPTAVASVPVSTLVTSPEGTHNLTFTATGGGKTHTCTSQLNLTAPEGTPELLSLVLTPETATIAVGDTQTYTSIAWYTDGSSLNVSTNVGTVYTVSSGEVATMNSNIATGKDNGTTTINAVYTASGDSASDSATLIVGAGGSLSATLTCPSGQHSCEIPYGTAINLNWTSTGAIACAAGAGPNLTPAISGTSGSSSTGNLTTNQTYTLQCDDGADKATDQVTVLVSSAAPSFSTSDKDITGINSVNLSPAPSSCSGGTDSVGAVTFKEGDQVSFKVNMCNTGAASASSIVVTDQLTNLSEPASGWNAKYNGSNITPVESGTSPNQTLTFTIPGSIAVSGQGTITFNAIVTKPSGLSNTIYRFQNLARINTSNTNWTIGTPLYIFYAGSRIPSKQEVAP